MARTRREQVFLDLLRVLEERPEWKARLRQILLTEDLLALPEKMDRSLAVQEEMLERIARIEEENRKIWEEIHKIWEEIQAIKEENHRIWQEIQAIKEENHKIWEEIAAIMEDIRELKKENQKIWKEIAAIKEDIREVREENHKIWQEIEAIKEDIREIREENRKIWEEIRALKEENRRIWEEIRAIKITLRDEVLPVLQDLQEWRRGEEGHRRGERYEQRIIRNAPVLFAGGEGGSPEHPDIQRRLQVLLGEQIARIPDLTDSVFLADLVWWKGGKVLVVEVSLRVNGKDVERAARRASVLRDAGVDAIGVVVGEEWVGDARDRAREAGVAWYVDGEFSKELLEIRKAPA